MLFSSSAELVALPAEWFDHVFCSGLKENLKILCCCLHVVLDFFIPGRLVQLFMYKICLLVQRMTIRGTKSMYYLIRPLLKYLFVS